MQETNQEIKTIQITQKESKVIWLLYEGFTRKQISEKLNTKIRTIDSRISKIFKVLEIKSVVQLVVLIAKSLVSFEIKNNQKL